MKRRKPVDPDTMSGIIHGVVRCYFHGIGEVEFRLSLEERAGWLEAVLRSKDSWLGYSIAHYMSEELEALVCGHVPHRYRIIAAESAGEGG